MATTRPRWGSNYSTYMDNKRHTLIVVGRKFGSGGKLVASVIGRKLDIPVYDNELVSKAAEKSGFSKELFNRKDEKRGLFSNSGFFSAGRFGLVDNYLGDNELFKIQSRVIRQIAEEGPAIFVGRCSDYVLRDMKRLSVFVTAPQADCVKRVAEREGIGQEEAAKYVEKQNRQRETYYNYFTFGDWGVASNYDLCIDTSILGTDGTADFIISFAQKMGLA